jgi:hypothetical protein
MLLKMIKQIISIVVIFFIAISCNTNPPTDAGSSTGTTAKVIVTSNINNSKIYLNGAFTGFYTPDTLILNEGNYAIRVIKEDVSRLVLIEDFANVSCNPCVQSNKIIESLSNVRFGRSKLVIIKFPTDFPSPNDPFYLANEIDCDSRMTYYNIFVAPTTIVDGLIRPISTDSLDVISKVESKLDSLPRFSVVVLDSIYGGNYETIVTVKLLDKYFPSNQSVSVKAGDTKTINLDLHQDLTSINYSDLSLHTVVTETNIEFATPPGSNGETEFYDVMRAMLPDNEGQNLGFIEQSGELTFQFQIAINPNWNTASLHSVSFVQNKITKEVFQAGSTF